MFENTTTITNRIKESESSLTNEEAYVIATEYIAYKRGGVSVNRLFEILLGILFCVVVVVSIAFLTEPFIPEKFTQLHDYAILILSGVLFGLFLRRVENKCLKCFLADHTANNNKPNKTLHTNP